MISEGLDNDPTYRKLMDERDQLAKMLEDFDTRNPQQFYMEHYRTDARYRRYEDEMLRLTSRIGEYERAFTKADPDSSSQGVVDPKTIIPVVIETNEGLKRYFAKHPEALYDLSPRKFEILIADILRDFGFEVVLTQATHDRGIDIYAYMKNRVGSFLTFVECKRWQPQKHVGIEVVQRLYGVQQVNQANKSMIVTTSFFTKPAIEECRRYEHLMELKDYNALKEWLNSYQ
jgi:restriction endonuclease Mrr